MIIQIKYQRIIIYYNNNKLKMSNRDKVYGRPDNTKKLSTYIRDSENTMLYTVNDAQHRFLGNWNKLINLKSQLFFENKEKYLNVYQARFNAKLDIGTVPICFDKCISDVEEPGLNGDEKNCIRECYLKRLSSKDDLGLLFNQKMTLANVSAARDATV